MKQSLLAPIIAVIVFGGFFYFYQSGSFRSEQSSTASSTSQTASDQSQTSISTATNYDECIAEGNQPLPDAPDKCLTTNGHIFIKGVIE